MALPTLPKLNNASNPLDRFAPSGNGWEFVPDNGWGGGGTLESFLSGGGSGGGSAPGGGIGGGPSLTWDIGIGGVTVGAGGTGTPGGIRNTTTQVQQAASWLTGIPWSRIAAFLLGLLLILGGIYLMKPVQQLVNKTVKNTALAA